MQRLVITAPRQAEFETVPIPPCPVDGLLIRARVTAISTGSEIRVYRAIPIDPAGRFIYPQIPLAFPMENGYSLVGEVVEVGATVTGFQVGDRVFATATHREYVAVPASAALKLPDFVSDEEAVFLNIIEVGHIALRRGQPLPGETIAIIGQGIIGLSALAYCVAYGFRTIAIEQTSERLAKARELGVDLALSPDAAEFEAQVQTFCYGEGADLVLEAASVWPAIEIGMQIARPEGKIVVVARHTDLPSFSPVGYPYLAKRLTLLTSYDYEPDGSRWDRAHSRAVTLDLWRKGRLQIAPLITHHFSRQQLPDVYSRLDEGDAGLIGAVIHWHEHT